MTPSEELRAAATRLRELTTCASVGPWFHDGDGDRVWQDNKHHPDGYTVAADVDCDDARWIAAMSPAVAEPLATLLESKAEALSWAPGWAVTSAVGHACRDLARLILGAKP